jgi:hypothetical protein
MKQQTAVEWLFIKLYETIEMKGDGKVFDELLEQAKEMEKEQIIDAFNGEPHCDGDGDRYYNETYKIK